MDNVFNPVKSDIVHSDTVIKGFDANILLKLRSC